MWQLTDRNIFIVLKGEIRRLVLYKQDLTELKEDRGEKMKIKKMRPVTLKKKKNKHTKKWNQRNQERWGFQEENCQQYKLL